MKKFNSINLIVILISVLTISSCDLERYPLTSLSDETFWADDSNEKLALTSLYRGMIANGVEYNPSDFWSYHGMLLMEHLTDNCYDRRGENNGFYRITSGYLLNNNAFIARYWKSAYYRIGLCNRFLQGIDGTTDSDTKARLTAEARFLRATQYHYLASYFKDVPLVTSVLSGEEANNVSKESQSVILDWCANEFKEAAADLPRFKDISGSENGRVCKQAALAFLGRTYMMMGKWSEGAAAYKEIIDYGDNAIHPKYSELFWPSTGVGNSENIFYIQYMENFFGCGLPQHILSAKDGGWSLSNPTAALFEAYEFNDGTPFSYDDPRYDPDNLGKNRDPRLDYTIYYNGATFMGTEYRMSPDYEATKKEQLNYSTETSRTGFMWRKYFNEEKINDLASYAAVTPIIRYAEVLLSYLECLVESEQTINQSILDQTINLVRGRNDVKMPGITETNSQKLREIVRHERQIELCYEGIRLWDIFRWGIADELLVGEVWGAPYPNSTKYASLTKKIDPTGHFRWYVARRDFRSPQDYTWPVPLSEQNINPNLRE